MQNAKEYTVYLPTQLNDLNCSDPSVCVRHPEKFCYQWYVSACMNRQHYDEMLSEVGYLQKVFQQVKATFYQAINHVGNRSESADRMEGTPYFYGPPLTPGETRFMNDQLTAFSGKRRRNK